jgi:zinc/manganese transport system substrate-binding protein
VAHRPRPQPPSTSRLAVRHHRCRPVVVSVIAGLLALLSFPSVGGASPTTGPTAGLAARINVVAAENFWGSIVKQLAGSHATVTSIITKPATDPHSYEATPSDSRAIAGANYVIVNGIGYDPWAQHALDASPNSGRRVLVVGDLLGLHDGDNPHQWYSPASVETFIARVTSDLRRLDPRDAPAFDALRTQFETVGLQQYHAVIAAIRQKYAGTPVGASESIVSPLAASLGLKLLTPPSFLKAIAEGTDPSAADKETVDQQVKAKQIKVFVFNSQNSTPDVQAVVQQANAHSIPVTTVTETLAPANATFQAWQVKELRALQAALAKATGS